jgi:uncharacterized membrane protein
MCLLFFRGAMPIDSIPQKKASAREDHEGTPLSIALLVVLLVVLLVAVIVAVTQAGRRTALCFGQVIAATLPR